MVVHDSLEIKGKLTPEFAEILTPEAQAFIGKLAREFTIRRDTLLQKRVMRQREIEIRSDCVAQVGFAAVSGAENAIATGDVRGARGFGRGADGLAESI